MRIYDFVMTHKLDADDFFIHRVQQACAERGWNFFLIEPLWVEAFYEKLLRGKIWPRVLLNMHSEHHLPDDIYHKVVRLAVERKSQVIDPPDVAIAAFDKAQLHSRLATAGFNLPFTVIVPAENVGAMTLAAEDRERLGTPFVVKPSLGYGKQGVVLDARSEADVIRSVSGWRDRNYLLQRRIVPRSLDGVPAYFRVFYAFSSVWCCWWDCYTDRYSAITPDEMDRHALHPLRAIACRLADLTGMRFFSTEIALTEAGEFVLIDYVNDQCHMLTQSASPQMGVPDRVVAGIARRLVEGAVQWLN
ncbi:MAG: hypothetical protein AB9869_29570 [Verrucomicrobiia bacterium]